MANRRAHKKLRAETRARMARTGESYQKARAHIVRSRTAPATDLVPFKWFGVSMTLAVIEQHGRVITLCVPSAPPYWLGHPDPMRLLRAWATTRVREVQ